MILSVIVGLLLIILCILFQGFGILFLIRRFDHYHNNLTHGNFKSKSLRLLVYTTIFLITVHLFQAAFWAVTYLILPGFTEFETFEKAFYFSLVTFTTTGYGEITIASENRIMAGLESINGIILLGMSTAFMFSVFREVIKSSLKKN